MFLYLSLTVFWVESERDGYWFNLLVNRSVKKRVLESFRGSFVKVLLVIPSLGAGGAERVISGLANDWCHKNRCEVEVVVLSNSPDFYQMDERIKIHRLGYRGGQWWGGKIVSLISVLFGLRCLMRSISPDVCMSFIRESNIITILASRWLQLKVVISERDSSKAVVSQIYRLLRKKLYPLADGLIVQTEDYKDFILKEVGLVNLKVIPNPVRNIKCEIGNREKIIINVGRLIEEKGQEYLLRAFSLCKYAEDWKLVILGDGILKDSLICKANELGLMERVTFLGQTRDVDQWLCRSSIFAFTSISEGFPNALAEAMSASLACVSFSCVAGPRDLIVNGLNGYLVDVGDIAAFAKCIDELIQSVVLRSEFGLQAKITSEKLDFAYISKEYFDFLQR